MVCSRTYILIEEEDFRRMSDYDRNVLKLRILDILNSSSPDEEYLMPLHFVNRRNTAVIRIGADILSLSFSHSIEQTRLDNHLDFAFTESRASPAPSSNRIAIMKSISKNGETDCKVIQFGCEDAGIRFPNGCDELWTNMHWSYHNIRDPRNHSDLDSKVVSSNCSEPGPSSTCTEDANLIADLSELLWGERSAARSPHLYKLLL